MLITFLFASCEKEFNNKKEDNVIKQMDEQTTVDLKIVKYLSITLNVKSEEIKFDKSSNNFIIRGQKLNRDSVSTHYNRANEYKLTFEN